jgi:hypothetical protein
MAFSIEFFENNKNENEKLSAEDEVIAEMHIGDFQEDLGIPIDYWTKSDYIKQWIDGVSRIVHAKGDKRSALIVEMYDPVHPRFHANYWALFKVKDNVYIQNFYQPLKKFKNGYILEDLYKVILTRQKPDETDLYHVSEWTTTLDELEEWLKKLKQLETD